MRNYCVVYKVCGIHYRYRCTARSKRQARAMCREYMGDGIEIVEVEEEY